MCMRTNLPSNTRPKITAKNTWFRRSKVGQIAMSRAGATIQPALSKATDNVLEPADISHIAGPRRSRIAKVNSVHSGDFEMLREITDELQVSNSTPFAGTGSQSTQHLNKTVPHVYDHRKTHVCEPEVARHTRNAQSTKKLPWQLVRAAHENFTPKRVQHFHQFCSPG